MFCRWFWIYSHVIFKYWQFYFSCFIFIPFLLFSFLPPFLPSFLPSFLSSFFSFFLHCDSIVPWVSWKQTLSWRWACKKIIKESSGDHEGRKGSQIGKLSWDAVSAEATSNVMESSETEITLQIYPHLGQEEKSFCLHLHQLLDVDLPGRKWDLEKGVSLQPR